MKLIPPGNNFKILNEASSIEDRKLFYLNAKRDKNKELNYKIVKDSKKDSAEIFLYDIIGGWGISAQGFAKDLKDLGTIKSLDIHINSEGGDVFDGKAIFNLIAQHPARVVSHIDGLAASIASIIALAGNEIRMGEGAFFMIHNAWGVGVGDAKDLRKTADLLDSVNDSIIDTYEARSKQNRDDIISWMNDETWMTAREAKDRGFVDVISEPLKIAAQIQEPRLFRHPPSNLLPNRIAAFEAIQKGRNLISSSVKGQGEKK